MTTEHDTSAAAEKLQREEKRAHEVREAWFAIRSIGTGKADSTPVLMRRYGDHIVSVVRDGSVWIIPGADGPASEGFRASEVIPASKVALLYPLLAELARFELVEALKVLGKREAAGAGE